MVTLNKKEARLVQVEKMREDGVTLEDIAKKIGVTSRTVSFDITELKKRGRIKDARKEMPKTQEGRDVLISQNVKTLDTVRWLINEGTQMLDYIKEWMGVDEHNKCDKCGCIGRHKSAQDFMAMAKIMDSLTNSLTLLAKVLGEITDSPIINVLQADADVTMIMSSIARGDEYIGRELQQMDTQLEYLSSQVGGMFAPHIKAIRERISLLVNKPVGRQLHSELAASKRRQERIGGYQTMREQALLDGPVIEGDFREVE